LLYGLSLAYIKRSCGWFWLWLSWSHYNCHEYFAWPQLRWYKLNMSLKCYNGLMTGNIKI